MGEYLALVATWRVCMGSSPYSPIPFAGSRLDLDFVLESLTLTSGDLAMVGPPLVEYGLLIHMISIASASAENSSSDFSGTTLPSPSPFDNSQEIRDIVDAPPLPVLSFSPHRDKILFLKRRSLPLLSVLARPEEKLAGIRIDGNSNALSRIEKGRAWRKEKEEKGKPLVELPRSDSKSEASSVEAKLLRCFPTGQIFDGCQEIVKGNDIPSWICEVLLYA
ncbi:hypothetical protein KSP39_PZI007965 [Platanthera zijinensis]|uniref:Uncharacterized protein n=1 Tax=Platanthera zijinensis TaxID=2320716 RepID=A0AAP0BNP7_9ASPA